MDRPQPTTMHQFWAVTLVMTLCTCWASAQFFSPLYGFNEPPIGDPNDSREMFQTPQFATPSSRFIQTNDPGQFNQNAAFRAAGLQTEGQAALQISFRWQEPSDPNAWVRLTTFNGPITPNPALHTQGKVSFDIINRSELFLGNVGLVLGIRETGAEVPQGDDGGTSGAIEWIGVNPTPNGLTAGADLIVDSTASGDDVQAIALGTDLALAGLPSGTAVIEPGLNGIVDTTPTNDDQLRVGYSLDSTGARIPVPAVYLPTSAAPNTIEYDLSNGNVTLNSLTIPGAIAGFTGNGMLDAPNNRGTLEHIAFVNDPADSATLIEVAIDQLLFDAPEPDPVLPPTVRFPIVAGDTSVIVEALADSVSKVTLLLNGNPLADITDGLPASEVTFSITPAITGGRYTATQEALTQGVIGVSSESEPVEVLAEPIPLTSFELAENLVDLSAAIAGDDLINGLIGVVEGDAVDPNNGVIARDLFVDGDGCITQGTPPSPYFHPSIAAADVLDLTDGVAGADVEAVLADFNRAALVVRYDFPAPASLDALTVFCANEGGRDGRIYQHYDVYTSTDGGTNYEPLVLTVTTGLFGSSNNAGNGATLTNVVSSSVNAALKNDITNLRLVFYCVSNTDKRFQDPWHGTSAEDAGYATPCAGLDEAQDLDGWRPAFEAPIIKEVDAFGFVSGDSDGDLDLDGTDYANLLGCVSGADNSLSPQACEIFDFFAQDNDVDLADIAKFQNRFTGEL